MKHNKKKKKNNRFLYWLVVWSMFYFSIIYGNNPSQLIFIFFKMVKTTNQYRFHIMFTHLFDA